jgi:hypothetical protein
MRLSISEHVKLLCISGICDAKIVLWRYIERQLDNLTRRKQERTAVYGSYLDFAKMIRAKYMHYIHLRHVDQ